MHCIIAKNWYTMCVFLFDQVHQCRVVLICSSVEVLSVWIRLSSVMGSRTVRMLLMKVETVWQRNAHRSVLRIVTSHPQARYRFTFNSQTKSANCTFLVFLVFFTSTLMKCTCFAIHLRQMLLFKITVHYKLYFFFHRGDQLRSPQA